MSAAREGVGGTITFASGFCAEITNIALGGVSRKTIDKTNFGSSGSTIGGGVDNLTVPMEKAPSRIVDWGQLTVDLIFNPATTPPISAPPETITIQFPPALGSSTPTNSWVWSNSFMTGFSFGDPLDDKMTASAVLELNGAPTIT